MTELINSIDMNLSFNDENIRVLGTPENPMFVVKDICKILGLSNVTETLRNIPEKWRFSVSLKTGNSSNFQTSNVVNQAGLYKIIMRCNKPVAKPFQEFVCEEILPSVRNTGEYKYQKILEENKKQSILEENKIIKDEKTEFVKTSELKLILQNIQTLIEESNELRIQLDQKPKENESHNSLNTKEEKSKLTKTTNGIFNCTLKLPNGSSITIPMREDGYINATMLCKAGGKEFKHWFENKTTKLLINTSESEVGIPTSQLIDIKKGNSSKFEQGSWIHPDLGIHLAQWISPSFALQVSRWTRELLLFGKVELGNEKSDKELEYKLHEQIKLLTEEKEEIINTSKKQLEESQEEVKKLRKKYVKQPKEVLDQKNVVYLMTSEESEKVGEYNVGKAIYLSKRKESYNHNKLHNFKVIYYICCKNSKLMDILESVILTKLEKYRCKAGRDVFLLPTEDITLFTNIFDECSKFYEGIDDPIYPKRTIQEDKEKQKERNIKYQEEHKEEIKEKMHEYYEDNKDILSTIKKEYYEKNADGIAKKQKEYYQGNKQAVIEKVMEYYEENKESILEDRKGFYQENKKHILEERKAHYQENYKTKIAAQRSKKETCECGMIISHYSMKRHKGTDRHKKIMEKIQSIT
uniref:KilA-N domain-containing protein n=1 Tax=viral metagenome TaxID=1070528 RepID=A0A6C0H430_9ZZZZ